MRIWNGKVFLAAILLATALAGTLRTAQAGCCSFDSSVAGTTKPPKCSASEECKIQKTTLIIHQKLDSKDKTRIESEIKKLKGVIKIQADLETNQVTIETDSSISSEMIIRILAHLGYVVSLPQKSSGKS